MISQHKRDALDVILVENDSASAEICLFGAHLLSFIPHHDGRERLWLSPSAILDKSKPIRGGIPICWPWFGEAPPELSFIQPDLPPHGFIRNQDCLLVSAKQLSNSVDQIVLAPKSYPFKQLNLNLKLEIRITVGQELKVELITRNMASASVSYFAALHTYF